jgi:hypothetical protein
MCTLGAVQNRFLFKTRDLSPTTNSGETLVKGHGRYRYLGIRGHASPRERGLNSGINEAGVAAAITLVDRVSLEEALASRTPRGALVEEILGSCADLESALRRVAEWITVPLVGGNIVIQTPAGGVVIEQLHPRWAVELTQAPHTVRANHFLHLPSPGQPTEHRECSQLRGDRMEHLLESAGAAVGVEDLKAILSDHAGAYSICAHHSQVQTVSAAIYDMETRCVHYAPGHPCSTPWERHDIA